MQFLEKLKPLGLLVLRVALGATFMFHGYPKLLGDPARYIQTFQRMGFPGYFAYLSGTLELFAGGLLIAGLFTRGAALLLAIEMGSVVTWTIVPAAGIYALGQYQMPLVFGAAAFALVTTGAGLISLDALTFESGRKAPRKPKGKE